MSDKKLTSVLAAAAHANAGCNRTTFSGPPGQEFLLAPITLTADAACVAPNQELADLLPELSKIAAKGDLAKVRDLLSSKLGDLAAGAIIVFEGKHAVARGLTVAAGTATVTADGAGSLLAVGSATVVARGDVDVYATDKTRLTLHDDVQAYVTGDAVVLNSYGRVRGFAGEKVRGIVRGQSHWLLCGEASFEAFDTTVIFSDNDTQVRAFGRARVDARGRSNCWMSANTYGLIRGSAKAKISGSSVAYAENPFNVTVSGDAACYNMQPGQTMNPVRALQFRSAT